MTKPVNPNPLAIEYITAVRAFDKKFSSSLMTWFPLLEQKGCREIVVELRGRMGWMRFYIGEYNSTMEKDKLQVILESIKKNVGIIKDSWEKINSVIGQNYMNDVYNYWISNIFNR